MLSAEPHTAEAAASVIGGSGLNFTCGRGNRELALRCGEDKCVTAVAGDDGVVPCAGRDRVGAVADLHLAVSKDKQILAFAEMRVSSPSPRATVLLPLPPQVDRRARRVPQRQLVRAISQLNVGGTDNKDDRTVDNGAVETVDVFVDARYTSATESRACWKRRSPPATAAFATCDIPSPGMPGITWRGVAPTRPKLDAATMAPSPRRLSHTSRRMALRRRFHRQGSLAEVV
jgi:hypothetical protein